MPRQARIVVSGMPCHIIQRGHNRSACFLNDSDYRFYLHSLENQANENSCDVHAYVLMTNHIHLLLTPWENDALARLMKSLNQKYVYMFNRKYDRSGSLWEGRFKSCITEADQYVLACYRYIEMNPVRAGMVEHPASYRWSSYAVNAGTIHSPFITPHDSYLALGSNRTSRQRRYKALVAEYLDDDTIHRIRDATQHNEVFGSRNFAKRLLETGTDPGSVPGSVPGV